MSGNRDTLGTRTGTGFGGAVYLSEELGCECPFDRIFLPGMEEGGGEWRVGGCIYESLFVLTALFRMYLFFDFGQDSLPFASGRGRGGVVNTSHHATMAEYLLRTPHRLPPCDHLVYILLRKLADT